MNESTNQNDRLSQVRNLLRRFRWRVMFASLGATLLVLGISLILPRKYTAEAIFERRSDLIMNELNSRGGVAELNHPVRRTAEVDLTSRPAILEVIRDLSLTENVKGGTHQEHSERELANQLRRNLHVTVDLATGTLERIRLTLVDEDPERARRVANQLIENYIEENEAAQREAMKDAAVFFREQRIACEQRIDELEEQRVRFELEHAALLPDDSGSLQQRISDTELQLLQARQEKEAADRWVETLESQLAEKQGEPETTTSVVMRPNPKISEIDGKIKLYERDLEEMLTIRRMTMKHPAVEALQEQIAELRVARETLPAEVVSERTVTPVTERQELSVRLAEARARASGAADAVALAEQRVAKLNTINADMYPVRSAYRRLDRQIVDLQRQHDFWDDNLRRVEMAMSVENGQRGVSMQFIHPCGELRLPTSPDLTQVLFAAIAAGMVAGVLTLLVSDRTDRTYTDLREPSRELGLPVLGATAELITRRTRRWRALSNRVVYPTCGLAMLLLVGIVSYLAYLELRTPETGQALWERAVEPFVAAAPELKPEVSDPLNPELGAADRPEAVPAEEPATFIVSGEVEGQ